MNCYTNSVCIYNVLLLGHSPIPRLAPRLSPRRNKLNRSWAGPGNNLETKFTTYKKVGMHITEELKADKVGFN